MSRQKVRLSQCPAHGTVEATKTIPVPWPIVVYIPRMIITSVRGYRCPECGGKTTPAPAPVPSAERIH
jgi:hypothetical protein